MNPFGEFPINDDWAYARDVYNLGVNHHLQPDLWPAMTLISQTIWGALIVSLFSFSFTVLKVATLLLAIAASLVLYKLLHALLEHRLPAFILTCTFCFNPLLLTLSYTFMTDVFFLSFLLFSFYMAYRYLQNRERTVYYVFFIFFCLVAVLNRQYGFLTPLVFIPILLMQQKKSMRAAFLAFLPLLVCACGHVGYHLLLKFNQIPSNTSGVSKLSGFIENIRLGPCLFRATDMLLLTGILLIPCAWMLIRSFKQIKSKYTVVSVLLFCTLILLMLPFGSNFPNGNILNADGIGPKLTRDLTRHENIKFGMSPVLLLVLKILGCLSVSVLISHWFLNRSGRAMPKTARNQFYLGLELYLILYVVYSIVSDNYFDRYTLPLILATLLLATRRMVFPGKQAIRILVPLLSLILLLSAVAVKDYFSWQHSRWEAIRYLQTIGIDAHHVDGGFEYNAWYKAGKFGKPGKEGPSWWWIDRDDFLVANGAVAGFRKTKTFSYQHYLPFITDTLFILKKQPETDSVKTNLPDVRL